MIKEEQYKKTNCSRCGHWWLCKSTM